MPLVLCCCSLGETVKDVPIDAVKLVGVKRIAEHAWAPCLSDDETKVVFARLDAEEQDSSKPATHSQIWIAYSDGSNARAVTSGEGFKDNPIVSPSGDRIVFVKDRCQLWSVRPDGSQLRQLPADAEKIEEAAFSPDGNFIAFAISGSEGGIGLYDCRQEKLSDVITIVDATKWIRPHNIAWTRDSNKLYFVFKLNLCVVDLAERRIEEIRPVETFALSPDGNFIACRRHQDKNSVVVEIFGIEGDLRKSFAADGEQVRYWYKPLTWSPDGGKIIVGSMMLDVSTERNIRLDEYPFMAMQRGRRYYWFAGGTKILGEDEVITAQFVDMNSARHYQNHSVRIYSVAWNSLLASEETVVVELPNAVEALADFLNPYYAELLTKKTEQQSAATRVVCTALLDSIYDGMAKLACEKYPDELANVIRLTDRYDYADPLSDGTRSGFMRRLKSLNPLWGEFVKLRMSYHHGPLTHSKVRYVGAYPLVTGTRPLTGGKTSSIFRFASKNQGVLCFFEVHGSEELRGDVMTLLDEVLEPFFALEFLYDAQDIYDISLDESLKAVQNKCKKKAAEQKKKRASHPGISNLSKGWPKRHRDLLNTGYVDEQVSLPMELKWKKSLGKRTEWISPVLDEKYIYACMTEPADADNVFVLDPVEGDCVASFAVAGGVKGTPVISQKRIYLCHDKRKISAFEKGTWKRIWTTYLGGVHYENTLTLAEGILVNTSRYGYITAIDAADGRKLWQRKMSVSGDPVITKGKVIYADRRRKTKVIACDLQDGRCLWERQLNYVHLSHLAAIGCSDDKVFVFSYKEKLLGKGYTGSFFALDVGTGKEVWKRRIDHYGISSPLVKGGTVIVRGDKCYGLDVRTGDELWTAPIGAGSFGVSGVLAGNYMLANAGHCVVDIRTGKTVERRDRHTKFGSGQTVSSPALSGGVLFLIDNKGNLSAFE